MNDATTTDRPDAIAEPPDRLTSAGLLLALLGQDAMRRLRDAHTLLGLKPRQFQVLALLHDDGPTGQRELGELMGIDPSILVTLLNPLEAHRLVSRRRDAADRRRHVVTVTDDGAALLAEATRVQRAAEDAFFAPLDDDRREQLRELLLELRSGGPTDGGASCDEAAGPADSL